MTNMVGSIAAGRQAGMEPEQCLRAYRLRQQSQSKEGVLTGREKIKYANWEWYGLLKPQTPPTPQ